MNFDFVFLSGILGASFLLFAFFMNLFEKWNENSFYYIFFNIIASFFLILYAYFLNSIPFIVINGVWLLFSIIKFSEVIVKKH